VPTDILRENFLNPLEPFIRWRKGCAILTAVRPDLLQFQTHRHHSLICLLRDNFLEQLCRMKTPEPNQTATSIPRPSLKEVTVKIIILVLLGLLLGLGQGWAASRLYSPTRVAGFHTGVLEGILMPAALPSLLLGKDLPIYAPNNIGRVYNIGFLLGINFCGMVFFGVAFWRPRKR
jgi:hypothetical protein